MHSWHEWLIVFIVAAISGGTTVAVSFVVSRAVVRRMMDHQTIVVRVKDTGT